MGTKSGTRNHAGARGARQPLGHPDLVAQTQAALEALDQGDADEALQLARSTRLDAVRKLKTLMNSPKASKAVQRQCARDILEYADRAKIGQLPAGPAQGGAGGLTVNIYNLTDGSIETTKRFEKEVRDIEAEALGAFEEIAPDPVEQDEIQPSFVPEGS